MRSLVVPSEENRGGVAVLIKERLSNELYGVKKLKDQIWFKLRSAPEFYFIAIYVAPRDSPYYQSNAFSDINENYFSSNDNLVILGDINARIGNMNVLCDVSNGISYQNNVDPGSNANGTDLENLLACCNLKPLNHMIYAGKEFNGDYTYRQGPNWISQLDWAIVSAPSISYVEHFAVLKDLPIPTDHAAITITLGGFKTSGCHLLQRATELGSCVYPKPQKVTSVSMRTVDPQQFQRNLPNVDTIWLPNVDINDLCVEISATLYQAARDSRHKDLPKNSSSKRSAHDRWKFLLANGDERQLWKSIGWNGRFDDSYNKASQPSDDDFCQFYENLLCTGTSVVNFTPVYPKYVPVLDDAIHPSEVDDCIKSLKANKAAGVDGVPPGVLKLLNDQWIIFITFLFNCIFENGYPVSWSCAKVFNIFKKGLRSQAENYRGISILMALAKLYDMVLSKRFQQWYTPSYEQAGAQPGRGCGEQILTLRLLIEIARKKKLTLYLTFVDFKKAYDKVDRLKLMQQLDSHGCGSKFINAIKGSYVNTCGQIGFSSFSADTGVRQGACSSCPLFTFFVDPVVSAVKQSGPDGWLQDLHIMLLMDDTVIMATSRAKMEEKLLLLKNSVDSIGMVVNSSKTQFMVIGCNDKVPFCIDNMIIKYTERYNYLGNMVE